MSRVKTIGSLTVLSLVFLGVLVALAQTAEKPPTELYVRTTPAGAAVFVDGKEVGSSPSLLEVEPGDHGITVKLDGHQPRTRTVTIPEGRIRRVILELQKEPEARDQEPAWGKPVEGVQCRVRAQKPAWPQGTVPKLFADLRNQGKRNLRIALEHESWELEIDGKWHRTDSIFSGRRRYLPLGPGQQQQDLEVSIYGDGNLAQGLRALPPGKHTLRVARLINASTRPPEERLRVMSNPIEIEITPAEVRPKAPDQEPGWGKRVGNLECRIRAEKTTWTAGTVPKLFGDLQRYDRLFPPLATATANWDIEIDGKWHKNQRAKLHRSRSGETMFLSQPLGKRWVEEAVYQLAIDPEQSAARSLRALAPGKHVLRAGYRFDPLQGSDVKNGMQHDIPLQGSGVKNGMEHEFIPLQGSGVKNGMEHRFIPLWDGKAVHVVSNPIEIEVTLAEGRSKAPDIEIEITPAEVRPKAPDIEIGVTPAEGRPKAPDIEIGVTPAEARPKAPDIEIEVTPAEARPKAPDIEIEVTPAEARPKAPDIEIEVTPAEARPKAPDIEIEVTPAEVRPKAPDQEPAWGKQVENLQCRIRAEKAAWTAGTVPKLFADLRSYDTWHPDLSGTSENWEIEIDGKWHKNQRAKLVGSHRGKVIFLSWPATEHWVEEAVYQLAIDAGQSAARSLRALAPGKHVLRAGYRFGAFPPDTAKVMSALQKVMGPHRFSRSGKAVYVVSNPIEIEILPAKPATGSGVSGEVKLSPRKLFSASHGDDVGVLAGAFSPIGK